jgi:hypothetical protein
MACASDSYIDLVLYQKEAEMSVQVTAVQNT